MIPDSQTVDDQLLVPAGLALAAIDGGYTRACNQRDLGMDSKFEAMAFAKSCRRHACRTFFSMGSDRSVRSGRCHYEAICYYRFRLN